MAEKRYYWLKLNEDYFANPKIKKLRKIAGGDTFTIIYLKMQLLSVSNKGIITFEGIENTIEEELALKLDEQIEDVQLTMAYLKTQGLVECSENEYLLIDACKNIGSECESAERVRNFRERQRQKEIAYKEPKTNALRQRQFKAKELCKQHQHIPMIEDYTNNKRYNGNYYVVFKRDRMKCALCGSIENLCVHHIDGFDENKPQNSNENKMITLCRNCHSLVHSNALQIPNTILESIDYFYNSNESNEVCNNAVTSMKQNSISISISDSISNNKEYNKENILKENSDVQETNSSSNTNLTSSTMFDLNNESQSSKPNALTREKLSITDQADTNATKPNHTNKLSVDSGKEKEDKILNIYNYWNSLGKPTHTKLTDSIVKAIKKALKTYSVEEIKKAISNYKTVLNDKDYYFDYIWGLDTFLKQSNCLPHFVDSGEKWLNYCKKKGINSTQFKQEEYDFDPSKPMQIKFNK